MLNEKETKEAILWSFSLLQPERTCMYVCVFAHFCHNWLKMSKHQGTGLTIKVNLLTVLLKVISIANVYQKLSGYEVCVGIMYHIVCVMQEPFVFIAFFIVLFSYLVQIANCTHVGCLLGSCGECGYLVGLICVFWLFYTRNHPRSLRVCEICFNQNVAETMIVVVCKFK